MLDKILDFVGKIALLIFLLGLIIGTLYGLGAIVVSLLNYLEI